MTASTALRAADALGAAPDRTSGAPDRGRNRPDWKLYSRRDAPPRAPRISEPVRYTILVQGRRRNGSRQEADGADRYPRRRQVLIEAKIYSVDLSGAFSSGSVESGVPGGERAGGTNQRVH